MGWWRDWRERRAVLKEMRAGQRAEEALTMDQAQNPLNLAKLCVDSGDLVAAGAHWERARAMLPNVILKSPDVLEILMGLKRYDEAEEIMRQRRQRYPRDFSALVGLARVALERHDFEEGLRRYQVARDSARDNPDGYIGCGFCLLALQRPAEAKTQYDAAIRRAPENLHALVGRARAADDLRDWPDSVKQWRRLAEEFDHAPAFAPAAQAMAELGLVEEADAWLKDPALLYPRDLDIAITRAHLAERRGDIAAACDRWATVRASGPFYAPGYHEGVRCLVQAERHADADAVMRRATELLADEGWPWFGYAHLAHARRDWSEAVARWDEVCRRFPDEPSGHSMRDEALAALAATEDASRLNS